MVLFDEFLVQCFIISILPIYVHVWDLANIWIMASFFFRINSIWCMHFIFSPWQEVHLCHPHQARYLSLHNRQSKFCQCCSSSLLPLTYCITAWQEAARHAGQIGRARRKSTLGTGPNVEAVKSRLGKAAYHPTRVTSAQQSHASQRCGAGGWWDCVCVLEDEGVGGYSM